MPDPSPIAEGRCPGCGASVTELLGPGNRVWSCGTRAGIFPGKPKDITQSSLCKINELTQQVERLKQHNEYLQKMNSPDLPRELVERIYRATCCVDTPELAQKQPCACVAAYFVESIEDWAGFKVDDMRQQVERLTLERDEQLEASKDREFPVWAACEVCGPSALDETGKCPTCSQVYDFSRWRKMSDEKRGLERDNACLVEMLMEQSLQRRDSGTPNYSRRWTLSEISAVLEQNRERVTGKDGGGS